MTRPLLVFLCGARDFHAMDWYRSAKELMANEDVCILTDLITGEGFELLINDQDIVHKLLIIDRFLFNKQSAFGNIWRNLIKILIFPIQVFMIRLFSRRNPRAVYFCHSMYYLVLAWASGIRYVGAPQGSDILIKPFRSKIYKYFSVKALKSASSIVVDSNSMRDKIYTMSGVHANIIQYGIDIKAITSFLEKNKYHLVGDRHILSIRGFTNLYRIDEIIRARNRSLSHSEVKIYFQYAFYESKYRANSMSLAKPFDKDIGRLGSTSKYDYFPTARLVISIPYSDSSPRSVPEAIFCGCPVAITYNRYYDDLPQCMRSRIVLVDLSDNNWLDKALRQAEIIAKTEYLPSNEALDVYDKLESFKKISKLLFPN